MKHTSFLRGASVALVLGLLAFGVAWTEESTTDWTQFGGPHQDFKAAGAIGGSWPEEGPKQLWSRELGEGYSAILHEDGRLYTMYRDAEADKEVVVCLDAASGDTIWEQGYDASPAEGHISQFGDGPRSTPLISGNMLYTVGVAGHFTALNKKNGKVVWQHDLWGEDFGGNFLNHGYSSSPMAYKNNIIMLVGGEDASIVAFNKKNGKISWKNQSFKNSYSTPQVLEIAGEQQLITFMASELVAVDPDNGELKWSYPHQNQWGQNINMPALVDGQYLFFSSPQAGARGLKLTHDGDETKLEEIWSTRKVQFYHGTTVLDDGWVYGSTGTMAPAFMAAINVKTGEVAWRERGIAKANVLGVGDKLIILDEDGMLYLASATPEALTIHSKAQVLDKVAWTVPTLIGTTMYVRDKTKIVALDLS